MIWIWNGTTINDVRDVFDAAVACRTRDEADAFLTAYRAASKHADANLGHLISYASAETQKRMYELFGLDETVSGDPV